MTHRTSSNTPYSFDPDIIIDELYNYPLSLPDLNESMCFQSILTSIRDCAICVITDQDISPSSKCMNTLTIFERLMNQLIAANEVPRKIARSYSDLMEIVIRASLCDENPRVFQLQYKHRLKMVPHFD